MVNDATLASDNPLRFRKNLFNIFTYSPLGKAFEKQIKATEDQGTKLAKALENLKPKKNKKESRMNLMTNFWCKKKLIIDYYARYWMRYGK